MQGARPALRITPARLNQHRHHRRRDARRSGCQAQQSPMPQRRACPAPRAAAAPRAADAGRHVDEDLTPTGCGLQLLGRKRGQPGTMHIAAALDVIAELVGCPDESGSPPCSDGAAEGATQHIRTQRPLGRITVGWYDAECAGGRRESYGHGDRRPWTLKYYSVLKSLAGNRQRASASQPCKYADVMSKAIPAFGRVRLATCQPHAV
jgi:hypothetical protein